MPYEKNDVISLLMEEHSRRNADLVAGIVAENAELIDTLFRKFTNNEEPISRRAAWVLDILSGNPLFPTEYHIIHMVSALPSFRHDGLKRHALHIISGSQLPTDEYLGLLMARCFDWLISPKETVAVKVYCMEILYRISCIETDVRKELADSIELRLAEETPGFRSKAGKIMKKLQASMKNEGQYTLGY